MSLTAGIMLGMEPAAHILALQREGVQLAAAAEQAGLHATVPSCPGWRVRDLLSHLGYVHRWAASYITDQRQDEAEELSEAEQLAAGPADDELIAWFQAGHTALVSALTTADPAMSCWTFLPAPSPLSFWARRQAHETAIHRADAQLAAGLHPSYPADLAADGVDELLIGFLGRSDSDSSDDGVGLLVRAVDAAQEWHLLLTADGSRELRSGRGPGDPASVRCTITGPASGLYLALWNRCAPDAAAVRVEGDAAVLTAWPEAMRITWA